MDLGDIKEDTSLQDDLKEDSPYVITIVLAMGDKFHIQFDDETVQ